MATTSGRGRTRGKARSGRRPDLGDTFFRSSWEANFARVCNHWIDLGLIERWEYEPERFRFPVKRGNKSYTPDFRLWSLDGSYYWVEIKGYMDEPSRIKLKRFALHCPAESILLDLIDKKRYSELCAEYGHLPEWET